MQLAERLNFNNKLMDFCLRAVDWKENGSQDEYLGKYSSCIEKSIVAEQLFRSELTRIRPGLLNRNADEQ